jgi:hypothetical protein
MKRKMSSSKIRYGGILKNDIYYSLVAAVWNLKVLIGTTSHTTTTAGKFHLNQATKART